MIDVYLWNDEFHICELRCRSVPGILLLYRRVECLALLSWRRLFYSTLSKWNVDSLC